MYLLSNKNIEDTDSNFATNDSKLASEIICDYSAAAALTELQNI